MMFKHDYYHIKSIARESWSKMIAIRIMWLIGMSILFLVPACDSPTSPESIKDGMIAGDVFWFVRKNHLELATSYRAPGYAYVTVLDNSAYADTTDFVTFISAMGDTERVQLHTISTGGLALVMNPGGASVYLNHLLGQTCQDGVFYVGDLPSEIRAIYTHLESGDTIHISASIKP